MAQSLLPATHANLSATFELTPNQNESQQSWVLHCALLACVLAIPLQALPQSGGQTPAPAPAPSSARGTAVSRGYEPDLSTADEDYGDSYLDDESSSTYIPVDSWMYPAALRLYSLGYLDSAFMGIRPWARRSLLHMLERSSGDVLNSNDNEAIEIYESLRRNLAVDGLGGLSEARAIYGPQSVYTRVMGIAGSPIRDSFHLGASVVNDYGRPYAQGLNNVTGFSSLNEAGRFSLYVRAEYQHAPASNGYTLAQAQPLAADDMITLPYPYPLSTLAVGPIAAQNPFRIVEASISGHLLGHEISFGKNDAWLGPASGGAWAWSNNAENIYGFRIDRVEPLHVPLLSDITGPFRYEFFIGSLKGHSAPNSPYIHSEKISFKPTHDLEFGFQRTIIWGGEGHEPVTLHTFLKGFFSVSNVTTTKNTAQDPGARFSAFDASWRLPYLEHWATLYVDSEAHDDVNPIDAPRRADFRVGLYLSHLPALPKLDLRIEGIDSDQNTSRSVQGEFTYWEIIQKQGYTNKGQLLGDWIGREGKGGQAWLTYHLSGNQQVQIEWRHNKNANDFIPEGSTANQVTASTLLRIRKDVELNAWIQYEAWKAPWYKKGLQSDTTSTVQITWYPKLHIVPED
jgi:hypothetical protein